jgi:hypothetical protein
MENLATLDNGCLISTPDGFSQVPVSNGELSPASSGQATADLSADGEPSISSDDSALTQTSSAEPSSVETSSAETS